MLIITLILFFVSAITYMALRSNKSDASQLIQPRLPQLTLGVQIICGDCCGEEDRPIKTYLDRFGNCAQCGGHSYILASSRIVYAQQLIASRLAEYESVSGSAGTRPFKYDQASSG